MIYLFVLFFGLSIGSFINAYVYRIQEEMTLGGRSLCPECKHKLSWFDLVPVFSWVSLKGKCRYCGKKISAQYPIVELLSAVSLLAFSLHFGIVQPFETYLTFSSTALGLLFFKFIILSILVGLFLIVGIYDFKEKYILSKFVYLAIFFSLVFQIINTGSFRILITPSYFMAALLPALVFYFLYKISKEKWMGAGDVEVSILIGTFLGWPLTLISYYFSFISASMYGLIFIKKKNGSLKSEIPFGPFLLSGILFAVLFGQQIISFYVNMFLV